MQFPNLPALVKFTEFGVEHLAFPVGSRSPEHHLGEDDEPLLDLVIVQPVIKDECARCGNSEARHDPAKMPPDHKFGICDKFIAPNPRTVGLDASQFIHIKPGVPHESHKFTPEQLDALQKQGNSVSIVYPGGAIPGGRWSELTNADAESLRPFRVPDVVAPVKMSFSGKIIPTDQTFKPAVFDPGNPDPRSVKADAEKIFGKGSPFTEEDPKKEEPPSGGEPGPTVQ